MPLARNKLRDPLMRRNAFPQLLHYATTPDALTITAMEADARRIAAPTPPPDLAGDPLLAVRVHETFVNNLTAETLSDRTITKAEFDKGALDLFGDLPKETQPEPGKEEYAWTITFAKDHPVTVVFDDSGFETTIRGTRFTSEPSNFVGGAMNIHARYKIEQGPAGKFAKRIGDLEIQPPNFKSGDQLSSKQVTEKNRLHARFVRIFQDSIKLEGLTFSSEPFSKAGKLISSQLSSDHGWLVIGWVSANTTTK